MPSPSLFLNPDVRYAAAGDGGNMIRSLALAAALLLLLSACADRVAPPRDAVLVERDDFARHFLLSGVEELFDGPWDRLDRYSLETVAPLAGGPALHRLFVRHSYREPKRHWHRAIDETGRELRVESLQRARVCRECETVVERFTVDLPEAALRAAAVRGFRLRIYARTGDAHDLTLTPRQILAQLAALDRLRR